MAEPKDAQLTALIEALWNEQRRHGWSTPELAHQLGMDESTIYNIRAGRRRPANTTITAIVRRFPHLLAALLPDVPSNGHAEHVGSGPDPPPGRP